MLAYLELRADLQAGRTDPVAVRARSLERQLQDDEAAAWKNRR